MAPFPSETTLKVERYLAYTFRIHDLLQSIRQEQQPDGSFFSLSVPLSERKGAVGSEDGAVRIKSTFTTSLLLYRLGDIRNVFLDDKTVLYALDTIATSAVEFLLSQRSIDWTWNYWPRNSKESIEFPYPDDLDDTFVALSAISLHQPEAITGEAFAKITQTLIRQETTPGGPFHTWIFPKGAASHHLPDVAVNSNILGFLSLHGIRLPKLEMWLVGQLQNTNFTSPFYPSTLEPLYFFSKAATYLDPVHKALVAEKIQTAKQRLATQLRQIQYFDPARGGVRYGNVSRVLEIGTEIEEICFCIIEQQNKELEARRKEEDVFLNSIRKTLLPHFSRFYCSENTAWVGKATVSLCEKNRDEMLLPWHFYADMHGLASIGEVLQKDLRLIRRACVVNMAGWIAYRAYDDILDTTTTPSKHLTLRNHGCMKIFNGLLERGTTRRERYLLDWIRHRMDYAIERECLREKADALQEKSLGCTIGPIQILIAGTRRDDHDKEAIRNTLLFLRHLLTARQLQDDCHDWQADLKAGFLNLAIRNKDTTEDCFWNDCFEKAVWKMLFHIGKAHEALRSLKNAGVLKSIKHLEKHLSIVGRAAHFALAEKRRVEDFRRSAALFEK